VLEPLLDSEPEEAGVSHNRFNLQFVSGGMGIKTWALAFHPAEDAFRCQACPCSKLSHLYTQEIRGDLRRCSLAERDLGMRARREDVHEQTKWGGDG
jgi:hypothetical protein